MEQEFGGLSTATLWFTAGGCFSVIVVSAYAAWRQLSHILWAIMLAAVAISLLLFPQRATLILAIGMAAASFLMLVSGVQAKRAHASLYAELNKLNVAVAALQGRLVLRLGTLIPPAGAGPESPPAGVVSAAAETPDQRLAVADRAGAPLSGPVAAP